MNPEKLKKLQAQAAAQGKTGGKPALRRKKKVVHHSVAFDDKKIVATLKKLSVTTIPGIEEVNMINNDGSVLHFVNPKVQASVPSNTFACTGTAEVKQITEMLPEILNQLGPESLNHLKKLVSAAPETQFQLNENDEVPELVDDFDEASKEEAKTEAEA